jgi:hypothetical protein
MEPVTKPEMSEEVRLDTLSAERRYDAVLRLSEVLSQCREPDDLTKVLSEQLHDYIEFLQFYIVLYKQDSDEVEWAVVGREKSQSVSYADVPVRDRPSWQAYSTQQPFYIRDWSTDERVPARLKKGIADQGLDVGPLVFVPLTTAHRRLGALGMSGSPGTAYSFITGTGSKLDSPYVAKIACKAIRDERSTAGMKNCECSHRAPQPGYYGGIPIHSSLSCCVESRLIQPEESC